MTQLTDRVNVWAEFNNYPYIDKFFFLQPFLSFIFLMFFYGYTHKFRNDKSLGHETV